MKKQKQIPFTLKNLMGGKILINADDLIKIIEWARSNNIIKIGAKNQAKVYIKEE